METKKKKVLAAQEEFELLVDSEEEFKVLAVLM